MTEHDMWRYRAVGRWHVRAGRIHGRCADLPRHAVAQCEHGLVHVDEVFEAVVDRVRAGRPTDSGRPSPVLSPASTADIDEAEEIIGYPVASAAAQDLSRSCQRRDRPPQRGATACAPATPAMARGCSTCTRTTSPQPLSPRIRPPHRTVSCSCATGGCANWSLLDCREPDGRMWSWDEGDRYPQDLTFTAWLELWLVGRLTMPSMMRGLHLPTHEAWF